MPMTKEQKLKAECSTLKLQLRTLQGRMKIPERLLSRIAIEYDTGAIQWDLMKEIRQYVEGIGIVANRDSNNRDRNDLHSA